MPHLQTAVVPAPGRVVVRLTGDVDASTAPQLTRALQESAVATDGAVVVDVAGARFRDGSGLQVLACFTDALVPVGRRCPIVGAPAATRRLVLSSGLAGRLELDGPVDADTAVPLPPAGAPLPHRPRPVRHAEDRTGRRRTHTGPLRHWR
ncbi:STAS domain-containing protein [Geodermatophilus sp. DSM 44513]|uniref:STAS domain-containing protein n=1 Tax=Geodermatophilus sp. DSM 44513 TaxID=1528104 RepID=UPI00128229C5|nr:STAS domain-containing protein [Geodermatophilus sp. DSM 44513]WNV76778.1 STAS domain-containing protein [Geodermatophilus sp. DSM 44513]